MDIKGGGTESAALSSNDMTGGSEVAGTAETGVGGTRGGASEVEGRGGGGQPRGELGEWYPMHSYSP